ncbi:MAG: amidohydrolase family protein, partial [Fulvivirga sp.]|nr:amidohydrolase family protein [Fulvivirga sp.]
NLTALVKHGLSEDAALAALTTSPAQLLGVSNTMGTVDVGKMAHLVITDKPYFDEKSNVKMVFVDGTLYEYEARKKKKKSDEEDVNPVGTWTYSTETPQGTGTGTITFEGDPGDYTGVLSSSFSGDDSELTNIEVNGSEVSFTFSISAGDELLTVTVSITIDGDTFEGTMTAGQFGSFPIEGEKRPEN